MKNTWMSMWLSAANSWTSAARGQMAAETRRSQSAAMTEMTRQAMAFWAPAAVPQPAARKRRTSKR